MTMNDAAHCNYIEPHREAAALRAENELLREELAKLITDLDYYSTASLRRTKRAARKRPC